MNDVMRKRIQRKLENLPDEVVYQVVDYIDFLERKYGSAKLAPTPLQKLAEGVEDVLRAGKVPVAAIKGTMQAVDAAGRMMSGVSAAGKAVVDEIQKAAASESAAEEQQQATNADSEDAASPKDDAAPETEKSEDGA